MGSEGRLWAALAKVLAQGKGRSDKAVATEPVADVSDEGEIGVDKERLLRETAKAH